MEVSKSVIKRNLLNAGFIDSPQNIMYIEDGLAWEDAEDFDTADGAVQSVIEDCPELT